VTVTERPRTWDSRLKIRCQAPFSGQGAGWPACTGFHSPTEAFFGSATYFRPEDPYWTARDPRVLLGPFADFLTATKTRELERRRHSPDGRGSRKRKFFTRARADFRSRPSSTSGQITITQGSSTSRTGGLAAPPNSRTPRPSTLQSSGSAPANEKKKASPRHRRNHPRKNGLAAASTTN